MKYKLIEHLRLLNNAFSYLYITITNHLYHILQNNWLRGVRENLVSCDALVTTYTYITK